MNRKVPKWRYWYSLVFYLHPWLSERGRKMQLYCCFNRSVVLKHVLSKTTYTLDFISMTCLRIWLNPISRLLKHVICWQERGWIYFLVWGPERRCRDRPEGKAGGSCELSSGAYKPGFHTFPSSDIETEWWEPFSFLLMAEFNRYIQFFNSAFLI